MTDIDLVYPYFRTQAPIQKLFPPLGIASLAAELRPMGIDAVQHDCTFRTRDEIVEAIVEEAPAIVGFYVMITLSRTAFDLLERLRERLPYALMVTGGPMPTVFPQRFADKFDLVFRGEADRSFPEFCRDYLAHAGTRELLGRLDLTRYPGLYCQRGVTLVANPVTTLSQGEVDVLPLPEREPADHRSYQEFWLNQMGRKATTLMATRGCPHRCDFCSKPIFGEVLRRRPVEKVMDEVREVSRLGYDHLWIADDCFTLDLDYVRSFCEGMLRSGHGMTWSCLSRVDAIDREVVELMGMAGCTKVYLGLESGSDATLKLMNKHTTVDEGVEATRLFHRAGIGVGGFFMVGYPGETVDSIESTFQLALSLPLEEVSFNVPYPLPGSRLYSRVEMLSPEDDWGMENEVRFLYRSEFDEDWLRRRIGETMAEFNRRIAIGQREERGPGWTNDPR